VKGKPKNQDQIIDDIMKKSSFSYVISATRDDNPNSKMLIIKGNHISMDFTSGKITGDSSIESAIEGVPLLAVDGFLCLLLDHLTHMQKVLREDKDYNDLGIWSGSHAIQ